MNAGSGSHGTSRPLRLAVAVVRAWTRVYTSGTESMTAERRRAEIESDLWELQDDPGAARGLSPAVQVLARLIAGVGDDVWWRLEHVTFENNLVLRRALALTAVVTVVLSILWVSPARGDIDLRGAIPVAECASAITRRKPLADQVFKCVGVFFAAPPRVPASQQP